MNSMSFPVMRESLGDQPKFCDNQWLRLTPRFSSKPQGVAAFGWPGAEAASGAVADCPLWGVGSFMRFVRKGGYLAAKTPRHVETWLHFRLVPLPLLLPVLQP